MKPVYLEFCGVNSFSETAKIDFRKLLNGGLFGIFGDTGSGKSTILDSIHFALYGKIERAGLGTDCINFNCDKATVIFDFEIMLSGERHTYRVQRERRRKNNVVKAYLYEHTKEGGLFALAEKTSDVDDKLQEIIGLEFDDFKKCIALPQGEFAGLVQSTPKERLTLVSRLFDLEKYGDRLGAAIRKKCDEITRETDVLQAKMQENEGGRDEIIAQKTLEIELLKKQKADTETKLLQTEETLRRLEKIQEQKIEYDKLCAQLATAQAKQEEYTQKSQLFSRASQAKDVVALDEQAQELLILQTQAEKAQAAAQARWEHATSQMQKAEAFLSESQFDKRMEKLTEEIAMLSAAQAQIQACENAKQKLDACLQAYAQLKEKAKREHIVEEPFDELVKNVDERLQALGEDQSFAEFLKRNFKEMMVLDTYTEICDDLTTLSQKYPQTQDDVRILKQKYTAKTDAKGQVFDIAAAKKQFDQAEALRKTLKAEQEQIEKRKKKYQDFKEQELRIVDDGKRYREMYTEAQEKISFVKDMGGLDEAKAQREKLRVEKENAEKTKQTAMEKANAHLSESKAQVLLKESYAKQATAAQEKIKNELALRGFTSILQAKTICESVGDIQKAKEDCEQFFEKLRLLQTQVEQAYDKQFDGFDESELQSIRLQKGALDELKLTLSGEIAVGEDNINTLKETQKKYLAYKTQLEEKQKKQRLWEQLKSLVRGSQFMEYIASEYLQEICVAASRTLNSLTNGRYFLRYDKEFKAGDNLNGGTLRAVKTLSGGETFLVSLSLALALSNAIFARSMRPIEFFFLDEGFGTLDATLVDTVMDVLGRLSKNFSIGLISHVEELKHRIENKIIVTGASETHGSKLTVETY